MYIPKSHPRYKSLMTRELLIRHLKKGTLAHAGLIAHGRGEAFDYLLGEKTNPSARKAEEVASAYLINAKNPVISVNGNTAVLAAKEIIVLSNITKAKIEINMFHWSKKRGQILVKLLKANGAKTVLFSNEMRIPNIDHARAYCSKSGIYTADVVVVPLEDGDRAEALVNMGKTVIAIDLNPLSRTSRTATVSIVDEVARALANIAIYSQNLKSNEKKITRLINEFNNRKNLKDALKYIKKRLEVLAK